MDKSVHKEVIINFYQYFYSKLTSYRDFVFTPTKKEKVSLDNFLNLVDKKIPLPSIGKVYWYDYFCLQFDYWRTKQTRLGKNKVNFNWIIGKEAWARWEMRVENFRFFTEAGFVALFEVRRSDLIKDFEYIGEGNRIGQDIVRLSRHNTKEGFVSCIYLTDLYTENNEFCHSCNEKILCMKLKEEKEKK
jgi:hypothetical protein